MNNITDDADDDFLDVDKVSGYLRAKYKEYARKKRNNFDSMVEKALELVMDEPLVYVGNKKSKSKKCGKNFAAELSIDSSDENLAQSGLKNLNSTNNMVTSLYDKPNTSSTTKLEARDDEEDTESVKLIESKKRKLNSSSQPGENSLKFSNRTRSNNKDILVLEHSSLTFSDIGGCEKQLLVKLFDFLFLFPALFLYFKDICKMVMHLRHPDLYNKMGFKPPRGFLLHGPPGCGKTMLAYAIAGELDLPFIKVAATEMVSGVSGDSEQKIRELFAQAVAFAPCILFLDEIDSIASRRDNAQREMERRIVAQLLACLDDMEKSNHQVVVIGATTRPDSIDPALRRAGRFDKEIGLGMPDERCREKILEKICKDIRLESNFSMKNLSRLTPGYVGADLAALAREACVIAMNRVFETLFTSIVKEKVLSDLTLVETELERAKKWLKEKPPLNYDSIADLHVTMKDFVQALKYITPSAKREGFATVPDITWDDVGALASVRESLEWSILYPIKRPELFESLGLDIRPQGVLLCGPPGCGKTLIAKAVANESGMNFISVKGPELLSMVSKKSKAFRES
uniref:AAA+ ATPase domain-containing protein n=1 Tax=Romanomermis culicivorax TaxID=13658 RepID=A0A915HJX3_ROMCU